MNQSMAITLDATHFGQPQPTGVEGYTNALLPLLTERLQAAGASVAWIGHAGAPLGMPEGTVWLSSPYRKFWSQTGLPQLLEQTRPNLYFTPSGIPPVRIGVKTAMAVHDLGVYSVPTAYTLAQRLRLRRLSFAAAKHASRIIVPSLFTAEQVQRYWKLESVVVFEGYTANTAEIEPVEQLLDTPYYLYVGRLETKKNLLPLLLGFEKLIASGSNTRLVLAGGQGHGYASIQRAIAKLSSAAEARTIETGYMSSGQKRWLYAHALAGVLPCPIEGFGLPVLDCFAAGIPALCAKSGALPEVGGDACIYVQPDSPTDWYLQMDTAGKDATQVAKLVVKGTKYLKNYTWETAADRTAEALLSA